MCKVYKDKKEAEQAVRKAVELRLKWENALHGKTTLEEMEMMGLNTVVSDALCQT